MNERVKALPVGIEFFQDFISKNLAAKGDGDMCTLFDEIAKENEAKGIVETGFDFGISEKDILERLQNKLRIPLKKAQEYLELYGKQTV